MKIKSITDERITFDDNSFISFRHFQECSEENYAYFEYLVDECGVMDYDFDPELKFEAVEGSGFSFGDDNRMFFVPCYSDQNGYYSDEISIYYSKTEDVEYYEDRVLSFDAEERFKG